ncbi:hypothetical protein CAPTEDRAFT_204269 [Capitella teleta]|uniref:G-protein coupled receptors family 1 profile domain-containing protein n=1 Tax=Capitella teleta TaxID=283909 RepID=R7U744_CAPTE|nr:hypothetical protein CAPTEDRAFT_204269 [Capitella teleta]|eukprot:ELU01931.1 hypothetical protein CAPTEDRAFT_204269 [Capitella teleta]
MDSTTFEPTLDANTLAPAKLSDYHDWNTGVLVCGIAVLMAGIPGNLLTILAFFKYKQLHSPTNILICSQSIGDLFTCLTGPLFAVWNYTEIGQALASSNKYLCLSSLTLLMLALQSSVVNILALSTERFIAVYFSLRYYQWVTDATVKRVVVIIWIVVITINFLPLFGWELWKPGVTCMTFNIYPRIYFQAFFIMPTLICLLVCAVVNFAIALEAIKRQRSIVAVVVMENAANEEANAKSRNQFKVTKMLLLVVGCFFTTWLPYIIFNCISYSLPSPWKIHGAPDWFAIPSELSKTMLVVNSIVNPFIYGWKNVLFRDAYYKLLRVRKTPTDRETRPSISSELQNTDLIKGLIAAFSDERVKGSISELVTTSVQSELVKLREELRMRDHIIRQLEDKRSKRKCMGAGKLLAREDRPKSIFINEDLTKRMTHLAWIARSLKRDNSTKDTWISDGNITIKTAKIK